MSLKSWWHRHFGMTLEDVMIEKKESDAENRKKEIEGYAKEGARYIEEHPLPLYKLFFFDDEIYLTTAKERYGQDQLYAGRNQYIRFFNKTIIDDTQVNHFKTAWQNALPLTLELADGSTAGIRLNMVRSAKVVTVWSKEELNLFKSQTNIVIQGLPEEEN